MTIELFYGPNAVEWAPTVAAGRCPLGPPACPGGDGAQLVPVASVQGGSGGQCRACRRVWLTGPGGVTWVWPSYHGGYYPPAEVPSRASVALSYRSWRARQLVAGVRDWCLRRKP